MRNLTLTRRGFAGLAAGIGAAAVTAPAVHALPTRPLSGDAWTIGLMSDTQWGANVDGISPGTIAGGIQQRINERMIERGVDFVVQVGDNVDREDDGANGNPEVRTLPIKGELVQPLYDAGIGFYSLRGNHESSGTAAQEFVEVFPQNIGEGPNPLAGATNFSFPSELLKGLSYSFDVKNVRIVMLDQFTRPDGSGSTATNILDQLDWIEDRVLNRPEGTHCLVFAHKNLIGQNHVDALFGGTNGENPEAYDRLISILDRGEVAMIASGHDHVHNRSIITSPDGTSSVQQLIAGSDSHKFYTPRIPSNADSFPEGPSETMLSQELWTTTHYIITIDGPRLYVDFYSMSTGADYGPTRLEVTPQGEWFWREQWGCALNGTSRLVEQGGSYAGISDEFEGTTATILAGTNGSTAVDYAGRPISKEVHLGWESKGEGDATARLSIWGIADNLALNDPELTGQLPNADETDEADVFVLQLSGAKAKDFRADGSFALATLDADGRWVKAVAENHGGTARFVRGAYREGYELGTYGVDPRTKDVWAVIDHGGTFTVRGGL